MQTKKEQSIRSGYFNIDQVYFKIADRNTKRVIETNLEKDYNAFVILRRYYSGNYNETHAYFHAVHIFETLCPKTLNPINVSESGFLIKEFRDCRWKNTIQNPYQVYTIINPSGQSETIDTRVMKEFLDLYLNEFDKADINMTVAYLGEYSFVSVLNFLKIISKEFLTLKQVKLQLEFYKLKKQN